MTKEGIILQREGPWSLHDSKGRYSFDDTSGWLTAGSKVGRFLCKTLVVLSFEPFTFPFLCFRSESPERLPQRRCQGVHPPPSSAAHPFILIGWFVFTILLKLPTSLRRLHHQPLTFDSSVSSRMPKLKIVSSDIMVEMQKKENHGVPWWHFSNTLLIQGCLGCCFIESSFEEFDRKRQNQEKGDELVNDQRLRVRMIRLFVWIFDSIRS